MKHKVSKNKVSGFGYEHRFVARMLKQGAKSAIRHYGSRGITDVEWTDQMGFKNEAQLKFSTIALPKISTKEMNRIRIYAANKVEEGVKIWVILKVSRGKEVWVAMN